ncbi:MAG: fructosamine kinase family protein [Saprospiraceae bacterium]
MYQDFPDEILDSLSLHLHRPFHPIRSIAGGDINQAYLLKSRSEKFFIKYHKGSHNLDMFEKESSGLNTMRSGCSIKIPEVLLAASTENYSFLLLEWIESGHPANDFWLQLGKGLANLHFNSFNHFGYKESNYIGRLPQSNQREETWVDFYWNQRLMPQLELAKAGNFFTKKEIEIWQNHSSRLSEICPQESPSLIHGDLWSGNFMVGTDGTPCLIDPAVAYSHREMDIAMTLLFGGFSGKFYETYKEEYPLEKGWKERMDIYQLYYLLVHLNLFGSSYLNACKTILEKYFR